MSKAALNFLLDASILVLLVVALAAQFVQQFVFPGPWEANGWRLWGLDYAGWTRLSFWCLASFAVGVLVHVMLHWGWVCGFAATRLSRWRGKPLVIKPAEQTILGVCVLIAILTAVGVLLVGASFSIQAPSM